MSHICPFCRDFQSRSGGANVIIGEAEDVRIVSDFAPIVQGHVLICPDTHYTSFANCPAPVRQKSFELARHIVQTRAGYGLHSVIAEHGTGQFGGPSTACCDHAHLHVLTLPSLSEIQQLREIYSVRAGPGLLLKNAEELSNFADRPYNILSDEKGNLILWENVSSFFPQFFRNSVCKVLGYAANDPRYFWQTSMNKRDAISGGLMAVGDIPEENRLPFTGWRTVNKLVRDEIPRVIAEAGDYPLVRKVSGDELFELAVSKVREELAEFEADPGLKEAADLLEAMSLLFSIHGLPWPEIETAAAGKARQVGIFQDRILLEHVLLTKKD